MSLANDLLLGNDMAAPKIVEYAPGAMPDIRAEGDSIRYHMDVVGAHPPLGLVIRCDAKGNVWASIVVPPRDEA